MANSSAVRRTHREFNSGELPLIGATPSAQQPINDVDLLLGAWLPEAFGAAIDDTSKQIAAARLMGMDRSQLNNNIHAKGHLSMLRAGLAERDTLINFAHRILKHCGVEEDPRIAQQQDAETIAKAIVRMVARVR